MALDLSILGMVFVGGLMVFGSVTAVKKKRGWGNNKRGGAQKPRGNKAERALRAVGSKRKKKLDKHIDERLDEI